MRAKESYEKPVIQKLKTGMMNKYGSSPLYARKKRDNIDGAAIKDLVEKFGSPLFVYSEATLRARYKSLYQSFSTRYPNVQFGWSYKTNYLKAICSTLHQEGAIAEVVSKFEYDKARNLGMAGKDIIFNGPHKTIAALRQAVEEGAMINLDNFDEIYDLEKVAQEKGKKVKAGMRLNLDAGIYPQWSRFGFNLESGEAMTAAKRIAQGKKIELTGLHCHIGTFIMDPRAYGTEVGKMVKFGYELRPLGFKMEYVDIGGGFPSRSKIKGSYLSPDVGIPPLEEYAQRISEALYASLESGDFPKLILETGRAMVDEAGYLVTTIHSSKRLPDGLKTYVADAGVNLLFTSFWYQFNIEVDGKLQGVNEPSVIYGPLCMNIDVIDEGVSLPPLERGARLIFSPVGAYNNTQWMQFIETRPNIVMIDLKGKPHLIREAEKLEDIESREILPGHLKVK
jgi:diaminopimelate decarboxylase